MNGYKTTIFEMHTIPGGLCTAWKRKGYTFDISMHTFLGSKTGPFSQMWRELGVFKDQEFFYNHLMARIESGGKSLDLCADPRRLEDQMEALSPADADLTKEFIRLLSGKSILDSASLKAAEMFGLMDKVKAAAALLPLMGVFRKYGPMTIQEFAERFRDPFLGSAVRFFINSPGWPMLRFPMVGWYITPDNMRKQTFLRTLPGLSGLYMVGQWIAPFTGTAMAALSGRQLIELLCKQNATPFVTSPRRYSPARMV